MLSAVRIVLVSPSGPANIGAVCRIMANMGLRSLTVVSPRCDLGDPAAAAYAAHGAHVLAAAAVVADLSAALRDCGRTYATTSKLGLYRRQAAVAPHEAAAEIIGLIHAGLESDAGIADTAGRGIAKDDARPGRAKDAAGRGIVALAFGPEDRGLLTRDLLQFDRLVTIPADDAYPVLNLAAAVTVCCYELRRAATAAAGAPPLPTKIDHGLATGDKKEVMFARLFDALERVGFLYGQNPDHLKYALRHLLGRIDLSVNEVDILIGLARQVRWYVDHHPQRVDPPE